MKEILTVGCGNGACHLAAHYFNIQEAGFSYNPELTTDLNQKALFREGEDRNGLQINPRFIAIDGYGSLKTSITEDPSQALQVLREDYGLTVEVVNDATEEPQSNAFVQDAHRYYNEPNALMQSHYDLNGVTNWTDYVFPKIHKRSFVSVSCKTSEISDKQFLSHSQGLAEWGRRRFEEDLIDNVRFFVEECDFLQGTQIILDSENGFSGVGCGLLTHLIDEYSKKDVMGVLPFNLWNRESERSPQSIVRLFNVATTFSQFNEDANVIIPLSLEESISSQNVADRQFKRITYKNSLYQKTAIMASSMDLFTMPYRLRKSEMNLASFTASITPYKRNFVQSLIALPFAYESDKSVTSILEDNGLELFESVSPQGDEVLAKSLSVIASVKGFKTSRNSSGTDLFNAWANAFTRASLDSMFFQSFSTKESFRIPPSYPDIWTEDIIKTPFLLNKYGPLKELKVGNLLCNSDCIGKVFEDLYNFSKKNKSRITEALVEVESDDVAGIIDKIEDINESYKNYHLL